VPQAARHHGVDPWLLAAILQVESGFRPQVVRRNANGSLDVGLAQINSVHFPELARHGISPGELLDPCVASHVAAWHLARQLRARGHTWRGLASYHSITPCHNQRYAAQVWNTLVGWGAVDGARVAADALRVCASVPAPDSRGLR
jgi:soluble lytic murein transglycosylase-like protein